MRVGFSFFKSPFRINLLIYEFLFLAVGGGLGAIVGESPKLIEITEKGEWRYFDTADTVYA